MTTSSNGIVCLKVIDRQFATETTVNGVKWAFAVPVFVLVNLDSPFCERIVSVLKHGSVVQLYPLSNLLDLQHSARLQKILPPRQLLFLFFSEKRATWRQRRHSICLPYTTGGIHSQNKHNGHKLNWLVRAARQWESFRVWLTVRLYSPWKTTMTSGQDVRWIFRHFGSS
jgi:hypothetical protein